jgi:hypothetical protein
MFQGVTYVSKYNGSAKFKISTKDNSVGVCCPVHILNNGLQYGVAI